MPSVLLALALLATNAAGPAAAPAPADSLAAPVLAFVAGGSFGGGEGPNERLVEPAGVTTDAFGRVYATDAATHRLVRWDADGNRLDEAGSLGSDPNQFRRPGALARLGSLGVAVLDVENRRVVTYDLHLRLIAVLADLASDEMDRTVGPVTPVGLAADRGGAVYVADADGDRVLAFDYGGRFLRTIGGHGPGEGRFRGLAAVAVDGQGVLVAADRPREGGPVRLQWFDAGGRVARLEWAERGEPPVRRPGALAIAVDDSGRVALCDAAAGLLELVAPDGTTLARQRGLERPCALAFAPGGSLLVAEAGAGRVRRYTLAPAATGE